MFDKNEIDDMNYMFDNIVSFVESSKKEIKNDNATMAKCFVEDIIATSLVLIDRLK